MLLDNHTKQSPIIGIAGLGGGINSYIFLSGETDPYIISKSLRFDSGSSAYLSRTPSSASDRQKWTWAAWVKKTSLTTNSTLFSADASNSDFVTIRFESDTIRFDCQGDGQSRVQVTTTAVYRDPSAWYHIVIALDTTQGTPADRCKIYVNSVLQATSNTLSQNKNFAVNSTVNHEIGRRSDGNDHYFDGFLADVHLVDGQALAPTSFGQTDSDGVWQPKKFSGSHGTNGFYINFSDTASVNDLGTDFSGNANHYAQSGFSITAGSGNDSLLDTPSQIADQTDSGAGGTVKGNYATFNSLYGSGTKSNGNLVTTTSGYVPDVSSIVPSSGKWYAEITWVSGSYARIGVQDVSEYVTDFAENIYGWRYESNTGNLHNGGILSTGSSYGTGTTVGIAIDLDTGKLWVSKNNVWHNSGNPSTGANPSASNLPFGHPIAFACASGSGSSVFSVNFGQRPFAYNAPTNFKSLNSANLSPTGPAAEPNKYFDTRSNLLAGSDNARWTISDLNFSTDLSVSKSSSHDEYWVWTDSVRGFDKVLKSDEDLAEASGTAITNVSATGFTATNNWFSTGRTYSTANWNAGTSNTTVAAGGKNTSAYNTTSTWSNNWTASGNGFGSQPPSNGFDANFDNNINNNAGGQYVTWNTTSYTLSGLLEINCYSSSSVYNIYVNGVQVAHTPSSRDWISCGSHTDINEIQFGGTSHNSSTGLGSAGILIYEIRVAGKTLIDSGTTPPNAPTIESTLRANPEAGFSIVTYSGGGSGSANSDSGMSFAHGLNSSPDFVIVKKRSGANGWPVYHSSTPLGALNINSLTSLDTGSYLFAQRRPSDSVVYLGNNPEINASGSTYVAYCFSQILGYSATGKYTGTGNDSGRFIYTGFRPRLIITKAYSSNSNNNCGWVTRDTSRDTFNEASKVLNFENDDPILNNSHTGIDILSNGFKLKADTNGQSNYSGWDYIYYAVAENPFKSARAR